MIYVDMVQKLAQNSVASQLLPEDIFHSPSLFTGVDIYNGTHEGSQKKTHNPIYARTALARAFPYTKIVVYFLSLSFFVQEKKPWFRTSHKSKGLKAKAPLSRAFTEEDVKGILG